jgi:hypothetical protein
MKTNRIIHFFKNRARLSILICLLLNMTQSSAQAPPGIPYQAIARNANGTPYVNANLTVRFSLHESTATGTVSYSETKSLQTNDLGLFSTTFGSGTPITGTFAGINWAQTTKFLQVEINLGSAWVDMGTQQLMSVPYAMYSGTASNVSSLQADPNYTPSADSVLTLFSAGTVVPGTYTIPSKEYWKIISFYTLPGYGYMNITGTLQPGGPSYNSNSSQYGCFYNTPSEFSTFLLNGIQYKPAFAPATFPGLERWILCGSSPCSSCPPTKNFDVVYSFNFTLPTPFWLSPGQNFSLNDPNARFMVEKYK